MSGCRQSQFDACREKAKIMRIVNKLISLIFGFSQGRRVNEVAGGYGGSPLSLPQ